MVLWLIDLTCIIISTETEGPKGDLVPYSMAIEVRPSGLNAPQRLSDTEKTSFTSDVSASDFSWNRSRR